MKKTFIAIALFVLAICIFPSAFFSNRNSLANSNSISDKTLLEHEHPTKEEWLEVYMTHEIRELLDLWQQRVAACTFISSKEQVIAITLASANGQKPLSQPTRAKYEHHVRAIATGVLKEYAWARGYELIVQFPR